MYGREKKEFTYNAMNEWKPEAEIKIGLAGKYWCNDVNNLGSNIGFRSPRPSCPNYSHQTHILHNNSLKQ